MNIKSLLKGSLVYGGGSILAKVIGFIMIPVYTRSLSPYEYGIIELIDISISLVSTLIIIGISTAIFSHYYAEKEDANKKIVINTAMVFVISVSSIILLIGTLFSDQLSLLMLQTNKYNNILVISLVTLITNNIGHVLFTYLQIMGKATQYTVITVARLLLNLSLNIYLIVYMEMGVKGFIYGNFISSAITVLLLYCIVYNHYVFKINVTVLKSMLLYGIPLLPSSIGAFVINSADRYFLQHTQGAAEVGIYAFGYKFGFMVSFLVWQPFIMVWQPKFFELHNNNKGRSSYVSMFTFLFALLMFVWLLLSLFSKTIVDIMAPNEYSKAAEIIPYIAFAYVLNSLYYYWRLGVLVTGNTILTGKIMILVTPIFILLYYILIPKWGIWGATMATIIGFLILAISHYFLSQLTYPVKFEIKKNVIVFIVTLFAIIFSKTIPEINTLSDIFIRLIILMTYITLLYYARIVNFIKKRNYKTINLNI